MRVVVDHSNKKEVLAYLLSFTGGVIALDTETYGLKWDDKAFALQLAVQGGDSFYFNFHEYPAEQNAPVSPKSVYAELHDLWRNPNIRWVIANAKFDMRRLDIEGVHLNGDVYDILLMERIRYNRYFQYSLDACLKRIGHAKNDEVSLWIKDHKAYTTYHVEGKKTKEKDLHYDRVPFDIMTKYGFDDVDGNLLVYEDQMKYFKQPENHEQIKLVHSNLQLTKTVFYMEKRGIQLDINFCNKRKEEETKLVSDKAKYIETLTNMEFKNGPKYLATVLRDQGVTLEVSDKGNPVLDKNALSNIPNAVAHLVLEMREHEKRAGSLQSIIRFADSYGVLHTNYRLGGTDTFRFSSGDPNLQNIEACAKGDMQSPRTAFVPRQGKFFLSVDYKTMEYRLCADIAGEMDWIKAINDGADPHQWVADIMGVERKAAKTLNFMLLYGGGIAKLALALFPIKADEATLKAICKKFIYGSKRLKDEEIALLSRCPAEVIEHDIPWLREAEKLKKIYSDSLPKVSAFTEKVQEVAVQRGYVKNYYGMRYFCDDPRFAYQIPNHLIQGTGACVIRNAMNRLDYCLEMTKSAMLLQIHDELIFEIDNEERHLVPEIVRIMETEYVSQNGILLKCDAEYSTQSWNANTFQPWSN